MAIFGERAPFSAAFGTCKRDPQVLLRVLDQLQKTLRERLFIDATASSIEGAAQAGLLTRRLQCAAGLRTLLEQHQLLV